jgi:iduronate 2-sulfatase
MTDRVLFPFMGYSLRTAEWRYTEWVVWNGTTLQPEWGQRIGHELYSHVGDDGTDFDAFENTNEAERPANSRTVLGLNAGRCWD